MDFTLILMIGIWVIMGLGLSIWAGSLWKGYRPFGEMADHLIAVVVSILTGLGDWFILPALIDVSDLVKFIAGILEPAAAVLLVLWVLRKIKPQQEA